MNNFIINVINKLNFSHKSKLLQMYQKIDKMKLLNIYKKGLIACGITFGVGNTISVFDFWADDYSIYNQGASDRIFMMFMGIRNIAMFTTLWPAVVPYALGKTLLLPPVYKSRWLYKGIYPKTINKNGLLPYFIPLSKFLYFSNNN